jgi:V/A-type H+/Na+-transporting ATPase subunit D
LSANRSVALELADERRMVQEGYEFLDEKRILLASEIMRRLAHYDALQRQWRDAQAAAAAALAAAIAVHGIGDLLVHPVARRRLPLRRPLHRIAGLSLPTVEVGELAVVAPPPFEPTWPSAEADACALGFARLLPVAAELAAAAHALRRLAREYTRTERRARALENVLLPELDQAIRCVADQLELHDAEEALRVHEARR